MAAWPQDKKNLPTTIGGRGVPKKPQQLAKLTRPRLHMAVTRGLVTGVAGRLRAARLATAPGS